MIGENNKNPDEEATIQKDKQSLRNGRCDKYDFIFYIGMILISLIIFLLNLKFSGSYSRRFMK